MIRRYRCTGCGHVWRQDTSRAAEPLRDGTGPARLLDMIEGRSKQVFKTWLGERDTPWRDGVEVVAMDGFTGFKTATSEELPDAVAVMDPIHVVRLAGDALDQCRRRVQHATCGHRGRKGDPLYQTASRHVLAYFDRPGTSNGPTEAINGRLEHLRGSALGFRNLTNYRGWSGPGRGSGRGWSTPTGARSASPTTASWRRLG
jgi:transposase